jgi:hypothetical protein
MTVRVRTMTVHVRTTTVRVVTTTVRVHTGAVRIVAMSVAARTGGEGRGFPAAGAGRA